VAGCFEYYADLAEKLDLEQDALLEVPMEQFKCSTRKEPLGIVGLITPWYSTSRYMTMLAFGSSHSGRRISAHVLKEHHITCVLHTVPPAQLRFSLSSPTMTGLSGEWLCRNYPMLMGAWKVAPALAAGCTCILKPSEIASM